MRVLVIGSGTVGYRLTQYLQKDGHEVFCTATSQENVDRLSNVKACVLDATDADQLRSLLISLAPLDAVISTIAPRGGIEAQGVAMLEHQRHLYLKSGRNLVRLLPATTQLIYLGSTIVYGDHGGQRINETAEWRGVSERALLQMEVIATFAEHPNSCVLLLGGLFGPTRSAYRAAHLEIEMPGTGEEIVSVLHVDDGVRAISKVLEVGASGVINVVAPIEVRWRDVMPRARWMGGKSPYSNAVIESRILPTIGFEFEQKVLE